MESPTGQLTASTFLLNTLSRRIDFQAVDLTYAPRSKP
jgi:hypothetical protein